MRKVKKHLLVSVILCFVCTTLAATDDGSTFLSRLDESEKQFLASHPIVTVLYDPAWAPLEYVDRDNKPVGMSKQYLDEIASITGLTFEIQSSMN